MWYTEREKLTLDLICGNSHGKTDLLTRCRQDIHRAGWKHEPKPNNNQTVILSSSYRSSICALEGFGKTGYPRERWREFYAWGTCMISSWSAICMAPLPGALWPFMMAQSHPDTQETLGSYMIISGPWPASSSRVSLVSRWLPPANEAFVAELGEIRSPGGCWPADLRTIKLFKYLPPKIFSLVPHIH